MLVLCCEMQSLTESLLLGCILFNMNVFFSLGGGVVFIDLMAKRRLLVSSLASCESLHLF